MLAFPGKVRRQPVKERDPGADHDQHETYIEDGMGPERRIKGVEDGCLAGENRGGGEERADDHEDKGEPRYFHVEGSAQMKTDHGVAEGDGKEGGEDNRIHHAVQS